MDREHRLLRESGALLGMIGEIKSKLILLKHQCRQREKEVREEGRAMGIEYGKNAPVPQEFLEDVMRRVTKMRRELDKYSNRLEAIWVELEEIRGNEISGMATDPGT